MDRLLKFQKLIGYQFKDESILREALSHSSYVNERKINTYHNNERLEFLGDAVLELITSEYLFFEHQDKPEGELSRIRASLVCEKTLAYCARTIELGDNIFLGKGERATGGNERDSILSDAMEALIGAVYIDGGPESAKQFVFDHVLRDMEEKRIFYDSKTVLQEIVHERFHEAVVYEVTDTEGPEHAKEFHVQAYVNNKPVGRGTGRNKKAAEQDAAYHAIMKLRNGGTEVTDVSQEY